jgi:hypothetical protein
MMAPLHVLYCVVRRALLLQLLPLMLLLLLCALMARRSLRHFV